MSNFELSKDLAKELETMGDAILEEVVETIHEVAKEAKKEVEKLSPKSNRIANKKTRQKYCKSWKVKKKSSKKSDIQMFSVENKYAWLTHLLEYGHINRDKKTYVKEHPHVRPTTKKFKPILEKKVQEVLNREKNL